MKAFAIAIFLSTLTISGCGYLRPYKIEVNQGNFVTQDQVDKLKAGMTRTQVRTLLGPPLIESAFHTSRWEYSFTLERRGQPITNHEVAVLFEGDALKSWDAKALPKAPVIARDTAIAIPDKTEGDGAWQRFKDWWRK